MVSVRAAGIAAVVGTAASGLEGRAGSAGWTAQGWSNQDRGTTSASLGAEHGFCL